MANSLVKNQKEKFSVAIQSDAYKNLINSTLGDPKRASAFVTAITSAVATNPALQDCDAGTILSAGLLGETLGLSPSPQMGEYYLVPFNDNKRGRKVAQFQLGYKGYLHMALKSEMYIDLNADCVYEGETVVRDRLRGTIKIEGEPTSDTVIGYFAFFRLKTGFEKALYWTKEEMEKHAETYSQGYKAKKGYTFWEKNFDEMGKKTMIRQLISKWGIMSTEFRGGFEADMGVLKDNKVDYVDSVPADADDIIEAEAEVVGGAEAELLGGEL